MLELTFEVVFTLNRQTVLSSCHFSVICQTGLFCYCSKVSTTDCTFIMGGQLITGVGTEAHIAISETDYGQRVVKVTQTLGIL